ncbi:MAG: hypothetical protein ACI9K2_007153 [Myxococcota bacterium]|jgi:hypothetical protein
MVAWMILAGLAFAGGPTLTIAGECPGTTEVVAGPFEADAAVVVLGALAEGDTVLPGGPCAGTHVGLDGPRILRSARAGRDGYVRFAPTLEGVACDAFIEVVDATTCTPTGAVAIKNDPGFDGIYTAAGRAGPGSALYGWVVPSLDHVDPVSGLQAWVGDPGLDLTALSFAPDGALYGAEASGHSAPRIVRINQDGSSDLVVAPPIAGGMPGFSVGPDGLAYGMYRRGRRFVTFDLAAGNVVADVPVADLGGAICMAHDADGTLYALSQSSLYIIDPLAPEAPEYLGEVDWRIGAFRGVGCTFHEGELWARRAFGELTRSTC